MSAENTFTKDNLDFYLRELGISQTERQTDESRDHPGRRRCGSDQLRVS